MSFGYAVGDFVVLTQLAWGVVQNSRKACGAHDELTSEVTSLHMVLRRLDVEVSKPGSILTRSDDSLDRKEELAQLSGDCKRVLMVLDGILKKYNALSEEKRRVTKLWKKVQFGNGEMLDLAEIRLKISTSTSALTLFLNLLSIGSQGKVENYMESQGGELREMRRSLNWITASMQAKAPKAGEGSILTTYAGDDKAIWKDFRRELIKEGFSSEVLQRHKETIKDYVMELGSRGALDDVENDGDDVDVPLQDMDGSIEIRNLTEEDSIESSEEESEYGSSDGSEQESDQRPEVDTNEDEKEQQSHSEHLVSNECVESSDDEAEHESPPFDGSVHNVDRFTAAAAQPLVQDEPTTPKQTDSKIESQTSNMSITPNLESNGEIQTDGTVSIKRRAAESPTTLAQPNDPTSKTPSLSPPKLLTHSDLFGPPEDLKAILPRWFGPYLDYNQYASRHRFRQEPNRIFEYRNLWSELEPKPSDIPNLATHNKTIHILGDGVHRSLPAFCNWMFAAAQRHDQIQASTISMSTSPNPLSPLAAELRHLLLRACAYNTRIRKIECYTQAVIPVPVDKHCNEFRDLFRKLLQAYYDFVEDCISYLLFFDGEQTEYPRVNLASQEERDKATSKLHALYSLRITHPLSDPRNLGFLDWMSFLFGDMNTSRSKQHFSRRLTLANLMAMAQHLLIFFTKSCEDTLLHEECSRRTFLPRCLELLQPISTDERLDPGVKFALDKIQRGKLDMMAWVVHDISFKHNFNNKSFSRGNDSLSTVLERCDHAQEILFYARMAFQPAA